MIGNPSSIGEAELEDLYDRRENLQRLSATA